jgi:porphobilinogen deaminase
MYPDCSAAWAILTELIFIKTEGDLVLDTPLPMLGGKGVFTKALDDALLENRIDLAVHSFKDIPTRCPAGLPLPLLPNVKTTGMYWFCATDCT